LPIKDRPKCTYCGKPLHPRVYQVWEKQTDEHGTCAVPVPREFLGYGDGFSCGPLHGYKWALHTAPPNREWHYHGQEGLDMEKLFFSSCSHTPYIHAAEDEWPEIPCCVQPTVT